MVIEIIGTIIIVSFINIILSLFNKKTNLLSCGIVGFSGLNNYNLDKIKALLLWNSWERGEDATGIYTPLSGLHKDNEKAKKYLTSYKLNKILPDTSLIAHVRKKSIGGNLAINAHPYEMSNYVMCHNGTLSNYDELEDHYEIDVNKYNTDSQILAHCLSENYDKNEEYKVLGQYEGAAAILAYNKDNEKIIVYRDNQRPLYYGFINTSEMYISSIKESLELIECKDIKEFEADKIYEIYNGEILAKLNVPKNVKIPKLFNIKAATYQDYISSASNKLPRYFFRGNKQYTGLLEIIAMASHMAGYYVRYDSLSVRYFDGAGPSMTKNKWYYISFEKNSSQSRKVTIIDDYGLEQDIEISKFDTTNFIPVPGNYVRLTSDIFSTENAQKQFGFKNDIVLVLKHDWLEENIKVKNEFTNMWYTIPVALCRNIVKEEYIQYKNNIDEFRKSFTQSNAICDNNINKSNLPTLFHFPNQQNTSDNNSTEEDFKQDNDSDDNTNSTCKEKLIELIENDSPDFIPSESVLFLVSLIDSQIIDIKDSLLNKENIDFQIEELHQLILNAHDINYIESLNEEEYYGNDDIEEIEVDEDSVTEEKTTIIVEEKSVNI